MIPILYDKTETAFISNGLARLRDCISCTVTEERNGIYELDFEYPMDGANYDLIQVGRIVGVTHDESGDIQPFDIVSFEKPIDGIVTFHCTHISYRMTHMSVRCASANINSLSAAFTWITTYAQPTPIPFNFWTDKTSTGYCAALQSVPYTVRQVLGGVEGSILDTYGGEYEWDKWTVKLWSARGQYMDFSIRYGVNMLDYNEEYDTTNCYSSVRPYWTDGTTTIVGDKQTLSALPPSGRDQCVPLDLSEKFESQPTKAQVESMAVSVMNSQNPTIPSQNIEVSFVRLQDMGEFADYQALLQCKLCDTINVIFPDFNSSGQFKIVQTEWNVLTGKYESMQLGDLSISLSEALGISNTLDRSGGGGGGLLDLFYPVGSYYETSDVSFDPNNAWGGTWELETSGQVHVSAGTGYIVAGALTNTSDGGESTHNLNTDEIPSHTHGSKSLTGTMNMLAWANSSGTGICSQTEQSYNLKSPGSGTQIGTVKKSIDASHTHNSVGGSQPHNNMQPYIVVNRWHRTA